MNVISRTRSQIVLFFDPKKANKIELYAGDIFQKFKDLNVFETEPNILPLPQIKDIDLLNSLPVVEFNSDSKRLLITKDRIDFSLLLENQEDELERYINIIFDIFGEKKYIGTIFNRVGIVNQYFVEKVNNKYFSSVIKPEFKNIFKGDENFEFSLTFSKRHTINKITINDAIIINSALQENSSEENKFGYIISRDINTVKNDLDSINREQCLEINTFSENSQKIEELYKLVYEKDI